MNQERRNIPFFDWLPSKINKKGTIMTNSKSTQTWKTEKGKIELVHPPWSIIKHKDINATPLTAIPLQKMFK